VPVLSLTIRHDGLLSIVAPLGAAAAVGTALVVDLAPDAPPLPGGRRTVADLVADGPSAEDLTPHRRGVAVLRSGGVDADAAGDVVAALRQGWPFLVERRPSAGIVVAPVFGPPSDAVVHQPTGLVPLPPDLPGIVLPRLSPSTAKRLLTGREAGGRWVRAWRRVWRST
jgi:hypothetical protein